jgi:hypothetical protein
MERLAENSYAADTPSVIPAKAGIQGAEIEAPALDPRFRGCQEIDGCLDQRCASFEASLREAPQDEDFLNAIKRLPHAEERPKGASRSTDGLAAALLPLCRSIS